MDMRNSFMAIPALSVSIDYHNGRLMASYAIILQNLPAVRRYCYLFRDLSGMEYDKVFKAVNGFPQIVNEFVFIRQMAVDAVFSPDGRRQCIHASY